MTYYKDPSVLTYSGTQVKDSTTQWINGYQKSNQIRCVTTTAVVTSWKQRGIENQVEKLVKRPVRAYGWHDPVFLTFPKEKRERGGGAKNRFPQRRPKRSVGVRVSSASRCFFAAPKKIIGCLSNSLYGHKNTVEGEREMGHPENKKMKR